MAESYPEDIVTCAMQPIIDLDIPLVLRSSIERHGRDLMELAVGLLNAGMDEQHIRPVIKQACSSYRDELISAILGLREHHEKQ